MRQIEVINQETIIDVTAETSNVEILVRDYDSELVERFALEAQEAAIDAEESADIATAQASIATAQATIATTQAGIATTQAGIATTQAGIATTKANEASASAASALASEQAADADRIAAQAAASTATTQAGIATTQAGIATTKAGEASASAAAALASETDAETAASTATTQAGIATTQAGIATTQAGIATTQAGNALTSANNAAASAAAAAQVGTSTPLTGFSTGANSTILATDTILQGFNKTQGQINARVSGTGTSGQVAFWSGTGTQTGDNGFFRQSATGSIGIGTNTPRKSTFFNTTLTIESTGITGTELVGTQTGLTGTVSAITFINNSSTDTTFQKRLAQITVVNSGSVNSGDLSLGVFDAGTFRQPIFIKANGNVLINTTTDAGFRLDVNGTARVSGDFKLGDGSQRNIIGPLNNSLGIYSSPNSTTEGILFSTDDGATVEMFLQDGGNLGIGTITPTFKLDVNGTARVQGVLTATADAVVNGVNIGVGGGAIGSNTRVGLNALNGNTTGASNTAIGWRSLQTNSTGASNVAIGTQSLQNSTTASQNTAIGTGSLQETTIGGSNTAIGNLSLLNNTTGGNNSAIGNIAGRFIADGTTNLTIANNSVFIGAQTRAAADNQTNQIVIGFLAIGLGSNTTVIGNSSTTFGRWFGNLLVGSSTNSGQMLQVTGTSLLNGLSTIQGTTASDSGQLGTELLTTGTGDASWTGTSFATGYTHVAGSTTTLTSTLAGVVNTFYQITYTVTGRTAGSFVIDFGGLTSSALTATGAVGPRATTTGTLVITPTSDFNGTIVLSIRVITPSSASVTFNNSAGSATNHIRISNSLTNTIIGRDSGQRNTTGTNNSFYGQAAGDSNTTGVGNSFFGRVSGLSNTTGAGNSFFGNGSGQSNTTAGNNSFFGQSSGQLNTIGSSNSFFGSNSGAANTTGASNSFFGVNAGFSNTTASSNSFFGENAGLANTTGANNIAFGRNSGRYAGAGTTAMTSVNNSIYLGFQTRGLNATGSTNEVVIGYDVVGLGSNTTVLGNSSTTHGRWYGSLLLGTTTNAASSILTMESTTQGFLPPRMTTTQKNAIASPATGLVVYDNTLNKLSVFTGLVWETVTSL